MIRTLVTVLALGVATCFGYRYFQLRSVVQTLSRKIAALNPDITMANDPIQTLQSVSTFIDTLEADLKSLQSTASTSDSVSPDVQAQIDALADKVSQFNASLPAAPAPAASPATPAS